jgi:hypothetical protein
MKHYTHIYLAHKAVEFMWDALDDVRYKKGGKANKTTRDNLRDGAVDLQRILFSHIDKITEASWAPDDILCDMKTFHIFKLYTDEAFTDAAQFAEYAYDINSKTYYRASKGGGLPFKIDHLARILGDMIKLRRFNDSFLMEHITYQLFLLSHYIVDAVVPMHCDIRDDKAGPKKPSGGKYFGEDWHSKVEGDWEASTFPVGMEDKILWKERRKIKGSPKYSDKVKFDSSSKEHIKEIRTIAISENDLMDYTMELCAKSNERSLELFPLDDPDQVNWAILPDMTREIFADCIANVISIWMYIWRFGNEVNKK